MRFRVGGADLHVSFGMLLLVAFCITAEEMRALLLSFAALAVHEAAHVIAVKNLGGRITRVSVYPFGAVITPELFGKDRDAWVIAAAGPIGSLALSGGLALLRAVGMPLGFAEPLQNVSMLIGLMNLAPAYPLDGGRVFFAILKRTLREHTARTVLLCFTALIASGMLGTGIYLVLHGVPAWTLLLIPPFLFVSSLQELRSCDAGIVSRVMERKESLRGGIPQKAQIVVLSENTDIGDALSAISSARYTILRVITAYGLIELNEGDVLKAAAGFGMHTPLKIAISRLTAGK